MAAVIIASGHRLVFRAPYYPIDGPIEYVFNTIQGVLRIRNDLIVDGATLQHELNIAIASIPSFVPYFINCGFWRN
jgi:transposase